MAVHHQRARGVVVAKVPIQSQMMDSESSREQLELFLDHCLDPLQLWGQDHLEFVPIAAAFGSSPRFSFSSLFESVSLLFTSFDLGFLFIAADDLLDLHRIGTSLCD